MGAPGYENGFKVTLHPERLSQPRGRKAPTVYFVNSMSDLFHESVTDEFIERGTINLRGIHWVIVGGESGPKARAMRPEWVDRVRRQAIQQRVAFFFKQWGAWGADGVRRDKKRNGRLLDGRRWDQFPVAGRPDTTPTLSPGKTACIQMLGQ
jgi:protein gp37